MNWLAEGEKKLEENEENEWNNKLRKRIKWMIREGRRKKRCWNKTNKKSQTKTYNTLNTNLAIEDKPKIQKTKQLCSTDK